MRDDLKERPAEREVRCPYCHDAVGDGREVVRCAGCEAELHADCAVEAKGCASCHGAGFVVGEGSRVDLAALGELAKEPGRLEAMARPSLARRLLRLLFTALRVGVVAGALVGAVLSRDLSISVALIFAGFMGLALLSGLSAFIFPPGRRRPARPDEWKDTTGLFPRGPADLLAEQLAGDGIPPVMPEGPHPERCPACGEALAAWFCHHCGASAVPAGPGKGEEKGG